MHVCLCVCVCMRACVHSYVRTCVWYEVCVSIWLLCVSIWLLCVCTRMCSRRRCYTPMFVLAKCTHNSSGTCLNGVEMDTLKDANSENGRVHPIVTIFGPRILARVDAALVRMFSISAHYVTACWGLRERFHPTLGLHARLGENCIQITV